MPKGRKCRPLGGKFPWIRKPFSENKKRLVPKEISTQIKELEPNSTNLKFKSKKQRPDCAKKPDPINSYGLKFKNKTMRVLLDSGSSRDLIFMKKGSRTCISVAKRVVPQSWGTSNGTFVSNKVGNIEISFVEYAASKKVHLQLDIVEYSPGDQAPMYDLIIQKQTLHNLGIGLEREDNTNRQDPPTHDEHFANLQLKPNITRALRQNTCFTQESISTHRTTKQVVEIR
jgi:hypothetical protein